MGLFLTGRPEGFPVVCHALVEKEPVGAIAVTGAEAAEIDAADSGKPAKWYWSFLAAAVRRS
jgi:hypothetical protein